MPRDPATGRFPPRPGKPASGTPAGGDGWGGPANGAGRGRPEDLKPGARTSATIAAKAERVEALVNRLEHLAFSAEHEATQVNAAVAALKHLAPDANARLAVNARRAEEMTDDELAAIAAGGGGGAHTAPGDTGKPN